MKNEIVIRNQETANPYQNFRMENMFSFYAAKQFLQCQDCTELLNRCIAKEEEIREYDGTYSYLGTCIRRSFSGISMVEENHYKANYTAEKRTWISTGMLMNKLDASLFYWRELNPALVQLLSATAFVELAVISNWVKAVHFMAPSVSTTAGSTP